MDNVTHGFIGYCLARAVPRALRATRQKEAAFVWASVLASNLPDLDFVVGFFASDARLAYLLHHRGHTHTLVFVPVVAVASALLAFAMTRLRPSGRDFGHLFAVAAAAGVLHIGFDALNNYGVHPFYPFDNRWKYGDAVFIIEPLFLFSLAPFVVFSARSRAGRYGAAFVIVLVLALTWVLSPSRWAALFGTAWLAGMLAVEKRLSANRGDRPAIVPLGVLAAAVVLFGVSARAAGARATALLADAPPKAQLLDIVMTPAPGNAACWSLLSIERAGEDLLLRRGVLSLLPSVMAPEGCRFLARDGTAPLRRVGVRMGDTLVVDAEFRAPLSELRAFAEKSCRARAALSFLRAPFWALAASRVIGDLRYDREEDMGFAEIEFDPAGDSECPERVPPWVPPRADVLQ